jgi:hypothetical protein
MAEEYKKKGINLDQAANTALFSGRKYSSESKLLRGWALIA